MNTTSMTPSAKAYWSRPFRAHVETSHFSGTFTFDTEVEAIDYIFQQFALVHRIISRREYGVDWVNFDCYRSYVEGPNGRVAARFILFVTKLQSA